jgi:eukaryotic-like serine/threonine-protein kinase
MGTPAYMAPEQAEGKNREITTSADVYGLGAVLYHWLTGAPPFAGGTSLETIRQVLEAEPQPPSRKTPEVDRDLETICLKCLRKEPGARYPSADALANDLERWLRGEPVAARPVSNLERIIKWGRRNKTLSLVTAGALASLLGASIILWCQNVQLATARGQVTDLAENRQRDLVKLHVETGNRLAAEGDGYAALASFANAATLDANDPARLAIHRFRYAATLAQLPTREQTWRHSGPVFTAAFSADGTRALTASADGTARVWNTATGDAALPALTHSSPVWWAGFTADDKRILTRTKSGEVYLWDAASGALCASPFKGRGDMPNFRDALAKEIPLSPDGIQFGVPASGGVELRSTVDGGLVMLLPVTQTPSSAAWSADGTRVVVVCEEGEAHVFDARSGARLHTLPPVLANGSPEAPVGWRSVAWAPDGSHFSLTDRVFAARTAPADLSSISRPLAHQHMVLGTAWIGNGSRLLTWSYDNTLRVWEATAQRHVFPPVRLGGPVLDAALSPAQNWIAAACRDGTVTLHDPTIGERPVSILSHGGMVLDAAWSRDGSRLITAGSDGLAQLWKIAGLSEADSICRHSGAVDKIAVSPGGTLVAALALQPDLAVWRMPAGISAAVLPHGTPVTSAAWLGETQLLTVTGDGTLRRWEVATGKKLTERTIPNVSGKTLREFRLSPDGRFLAIARTDKPLELLRCDDFTSVTTLGPAPALSMLWSPCSAKIATLHRNGGAFNSVLHSIPASGIPTVSPRSLAAHPVAMSAAARYHAISGADYSVRVYGHRSGPSKPMPHKSLILSAAFTADGRILATGTQDGALRLWDAETGEPLSPPMIHQSWIMCCAPAPDNQHFYTGVNGGLLSAWSIPSTSLSPDDMRRLAHPQEQH